MSKYLLSYFIVLIVGVAVGDPTGTIVSCKKNDKTCIHTSAKIALKKFIEGYPDRGVEPCDPILLEEIVGDLSTLKFKFTDTLVTGFKNCEIADDDIVLDVVKKKMKVNLACKDIHLKGNYTITGQLIILPVEGDGPYEIHCKKYLFKLDMDLKLVEASDGQQHLAIKNFKFKPEALEPVSFDFRNLFNGKNKDLADGVLKFANGNWKEVADFVQEPVISSLLTKVVKNFNKFFKLVSIDELYLA